jgi:ribosomal protein S27E
MSVYETKPPSTYSLVDVRCVWCKHPRHQVVQGTFEVRCQNCGRTYSDLASFEETSLKAADPVSVARALSVLRASINASGGSA